MRTVLVTIQGPRRSIDLEVPGEVPLRDLIPELMPLCGPPLPSGVLADPSLWAFSVAGGDLLPTQSTLIDCGIMDGAILTFQDRASWIAERERAQQFTPRSLHPSETGGIGVRWSKEDVLTEP